MDPATLRTEVEDAVNRKMSNQESFTIVDISHPIIDKDLHVRHKDVKSIVNDLHRNGLMSASGYITSMINVNPKPGVTVQARLWHPDTVDPSEYQTTNRELVRPAMTSDSDSEDPDKLPTSLL